MQRLYLAATENGVLAGKDANHDGNIDDDDGGQVKRLCPTAVCLLKALTMPCAIRAAAGWRLLTTASTHTAWRVEKKARISRTRRLAAPGSSHHALTADCRLCGGGLGGAAAEPR